MINIALKNDSQAEKEVAEIVSQIVAEYEFPMIAKEILIEENVIPHSHPILTLNTRTRDKLVILKVLVHEQLHWWTQETPEYKACIAYLKTKYQDNGECNKSGKYPDSFWEHIIVCFNTRRILSSILSEEEVDYIYEQWQPYPLTEKLIKEKSDVIEKELGKFGYVYPIVKKPE